MIGQVAAWLTDPQHWQGADGVPAHLVEHLAYCLVAVVLAVGIALPRAVRGAHRPRHLPDCPVGELDARAAHARAADPPGDPARAARQAAVGMGTTGGELLFQVEVPCAAPLIVSGIRNATLQCIATATVAAYVFLGGLGRYVVDGLAQQDYPQMAFGALLVAALTLVADGAPALLGPAVISPGVSGRRSRTS